MRALLRGPRSAVSVGNIAHAFSVTAGLVPGRAQPGHSHGGPARALATIKQNKAIAIGKFYHHEAPAFGPRGWQMSIRGTPTGGPFGKNALIYHDGLLTTEIGQIQTQFDGPGHIGVNISRGPMMYNGVIAWEAYEHGPGGRVVGIRLADS